MAKCVPYFMDVDFSNRKTRQITVRLFIDQIEDLRAIALQKYHGLRKPAALAREAVDQFIASEKRKR